MKILIFFLFLVLNSFGQEDANYFILNGGVITYVDNNKESFYTVSFLGDSLDVYYEAGIFMIDSAAVQIIKWPLEQELLYNRYDSVGESNILDTYWEKEFYYMQRHIYKAKVECQTEYFTNKYTKQFLLKYFKHKADTVDSELSSSENDTTIDEVFNIEYQVYLLFTTNTYVTMINFPVYYCEDITAKIEYVKSQVANSVRIYSWYINPDILENQILHNIEKEPFIVNDSNNGVQFELPFWLNVLGYKKYYLVGVFPDLNNISNALSVSLVPKSNFKSFQKFIDNVIENESVEKYTKLTKNENGLLIYEVVNKNENNYFYCQNGFMELADHYLYVNFTATKNTYNRNVERFTEFANSIKEIKTP